MNSKSFSLTHSRIGEILQHQGRTVEAIEHYLVAWRMQPEPRMRNRLVKLLIETNQEERARQIKADSDAFIREAEAFFQEALRVGS